MSQATEVKGKETQAKAQRVKKNPFDSLIEVIKKQSDSLAQAIHQAGLLTIQQVNISGDVTYAVRLVDALGTKHDKRRVVAWLTHFGKLAWTTDKGLIYRKRKDINEATVQGFYDRANATPYWELTAQENPKVTIDILTMLNSILKKAEADYEGKEVLIKHEHLLSGIKAMVQSQQQPVVH